MGVGMKKFLLLATLLLLISPSIARADDDQPPPYPALIRADGKFNPNDRYVHLYPEKLPNGRTKIKMWGLILDGDAERFRDAIESSKPISELVIIGSPGGDLDEGIKIGRIIRINKISTRIRDGAQCASACNFVFLGGVIRTIEPGGEFITHVFSRPAAPRILLTDEMLAGIAAQKTLASTEPDPDSQAGSKEKSPVTSVSTSPPASDTIGKISQPAHLEALGCKISEMYSEDYDRETVQQEEIKLEALEDGKNAIPEGTTVKDPVQLARLRAMFLDYLCLEEGAAHSAAEIATFLVEMRLSLRFLTQFAAIANARPRPMTRDELRDFNIVNTE
jgi:hypothetical protein